MKTLTIKNLPDDFNADNISITQDDVIVDPVPDELVSTLYFANLNVPSDWKKSSDGIMWNGGDDYRNPGRGAFRVTMIVEKAGVIEPKIVSKAMFPDAHDDDNDCFMRFVGRTDKYGTPFKAYILNPDQDTGISDTLRGDYGDVKHRIRPHLAAGKHEIEFSGRSNGFKMFRMFADGAKFLMPGDDVDPPVDTGTIGKVNLSTDRIFHFFDNGPDYDDGLAVIANRMVADYHGVTDISYVIAGTCDRARMKNWRPTFVPVADMAWPGWVNAHEDRDGAISAVAALWREILNNDGRIFVLEGGPSEFTAEVLEELGNIDRKDIHVIQHAPANWRNTPSWAINLVRQVVTVHDIDNGNTGNNKTPDLFYNNAKAANDLLNDQLYGRIWTQGNKHLDMKKRLDFSDTVELIWLLEDEKDFVKNTVDFVTKYGR